MKNLNTPMYFLFFVIMISLSCSQNESPDMEDLYFGQKAPDLIPEIFAPGIVSIKGRYEHGISFSPDLTEVYFAATEKGESASVYSSKLEGKKWTSPKKVKFTKNKKDIETAAFVSPNGKHIYFTVFSSSSGRAEIWYVNRFENSWSNAIKLDSPINDDLVFYANQAKNGDLFYSSESKMKMYYAAKKNGTFSEVQELEIEYGLHGFISPSQDYLLADAPKENDNTKDRDIYVYFKGKDGSWSKPINLGNKVNSNFDETSPSITPDTKYLFFGRYNEEGGFSNFYWVSTKVINKLRPVDF